MASSPDELTWDLDARPVFVDRTPPPFHTHHIYPSVFTAAVCRRLIDLGLERGAASATVQDAGSDHADAALRRARVAWIEPDDDTSWLFERLAGVAAEANRHYRFELTGFGEDVQFTTYDEAGSFYTWHQDGLDGPVASRKLSLVVQLSSPDDYDGSDLEFLEVTEDYLAADAGRWRTRVRRRGTVVAFPAFEYHRVTPLLDGVRHSLVCWVSGPTFR
jgi:PKHD-type hydroxylase